MHGRRGAQQGWAEEGVSRAGVTAERRGARGLVGRACAPHTYMRQRAAGEALHLTGCSSCRAAAPQEHL